MGTADFELIPAIDLQGGKCVRLEEGVASRSTEYGGDPVAMALHWQEQGAGRLHVVDLDGAFAGEARHLDAVRRICEALRIPVQFGGGLRTMEQMDRIFDLGVGRAILGSVAVDSPEIVEQALLRHPGSIVVGIDARHGKVALRGWVEQTALAALDLAKRMKRLGVERIVYTDVSRDGMLQGVNLAETETMAREGGLRVIASGGVSSAGDVRELWQRRACGIEGVILGRSLYEKRIDFRLLHAQLQLGFESEC